jgi:uncharacterized peroxidase-related enzyme
MSCIAPIDPAQAVGRAKALLDVVRSERGEVPALMRLLAHSPAALEGYLSFGNALAQGVLSVQLRERIAIAVSEVNGCHRCLASHARYARDAGLSDGEVAAARSATSADPIAAAALSFARALLETDGHVADTQCMAARGVGLTEAALVEIAAVVAHTAFANLINNLGRAAQ